jgi:hypothetical protein
VALSGADTIDGTAASLVLNAAGAAVSLVSDGLSNWAIKHQRGKQTLASTDLSDTTAPTSWTPTDQSGAALTFTSVSANTTKIGNIVYAYGTLTYPVTASGACAKISLRWRCRTKPMRKCRARGQLPGSQTLDYPAPRHQRGTDH